MSTSDKIDKNNVEDIVALTSTQEGMLFHYITEPNSEMYFEQLSLRLQGELKVDLLKQAWKFVISTNEMLRTIFRWKNVEKPMQIVLKEFEPDIRDYDFSYMDISRKEEMLSDLRETLRKEKIDIGAKPYRIILCIVSKQEIEMIICNHHIIYDGWSNMIILKELFEAYEQLSNGSIPKAPVKNKFKEYIRWIQRQDKIKQEEFWKDYLLGITESTWLPYDEQLTESCGVKKHTIQLTADTKENIMLFTGENRLTPATVFYTSWGILLQKINFNDHCVFGTTVSGRTPEIKAIEDIVGLMINTIPLRVNFAEEETFMDILRKVDRYLINRQEYEASSITDIKKYINFDRRQNLFNSIMVIENYPLDKSLNSEEGIIKIQSYSMFEITNYALTIGITYGEDIIIDFIYDCSLFSEKTIVQISELYTQILKEMLNNSKARLFDIQLLTKEDTKAIKEKYTKYINQQINENEKEIYVFTEPENEIEKNLYEIWKKVLNVDKIGTGDNFFDIGGSSILLIQVHSKIEKIYPEVVTGTDLFTYPTISKLAQYIKRKMNDGMEKEHIEAISLPDEYLLQGNQDSDSGIISFKFERELLSRIKNIAMQEATNEYILLLSMFAYLFTEITGSKNTTIHTLTDKVDLSIPLCIDLSQIEGFSMLFKIMQDKLDKGENAYSVSEMLLEGKKLDENKIIPLFYKTKETDRVSRLNEIYDIVFEMQVGNQELCFTCQFNSQRLRKEKIRELVEEYCELIEALVEQY